MEKKLILFIFLGMFLISFASATISYENWRYWNGTAGSDYMFSVNLYTYTSIYRWNATNKLTNHFEYDTTGTNFNVLNTSTIINESFGVRLGFEKFKGLRINITQPIIADNLTVIWEYARYEITPDTWYPLEMTNDTCGNLSVVGLCEIAFVKPINWANRRNSYLQPSGSYGFYYTGYTIRARVLNATGITQDLNISKQLWFKSDEIRIDTQDIATPSTLYANDTANAWGCITKTGNLTYHSTCDLDIRGTFIIDNGSVFSIGNMGGQNANHNTILMPNATGSRLQIGQKCGTHGCNSGTLIYGNGAYPIEQYLYWYGNFSVYGSTFIRYGLGYSGFGFGTLAFDIIDSNIRSYSSDTWFFTVTSSGNITNTNVDAYTLYFYSGNLNVDGMYIKKGDSTTGTALNVVLFESARLIPLQKFDTSPYAVNKIWVATGVKVYFEESFMDKTKVSTTYSGYTTMKGFLDMHSLKLRVFDTNGNPIENATVKINNSNNFSGLTMISSRLANPFSLGSVYLYQNSTVTTCAFTNLTVGNCNLFYKVGDKVLLYGELDQVVNVNATYVQFNRNITGSFSRENNTISIYDRPLVVFENATTNSNGIILINERNYQLLTGMIYRGWQNESQKNITLDIFNFEISADGYETQTFTLNVTDAIGTDWDKPISLTIALSTPDTPSPASLVLDKIISLNQIENESISYNVTLRLTNKGESNSTNTNITDSDSENSPYDLGNITNGEFITRSYLENFTRNSTTYNAELYVANATGIDSSTSNLITVNSTLINLIIPSTSTSQQLTLIKNAYYNSENSTHVNYTLTIQVVNSGGEDLTSISVLDTDLDLSTSIDLNRTQNYSYSNYILIEKAASNTNKLFDKSSATVNAIPYLSNQIQVRIPGYGGPADAIVYAPASVTSSTSFDTTITVENQNADIGQDFTIDYWITNELETANYSSGQQTIYVPYSGTSNLTATLTSPSSDGNYRLKALVTWVGGTATAYDTFVVSTPVAEEVQGHQGGGGGTGRAIQEVICNPPYMRYGIECCLDANNNTICDSDEEIIPEEIPETPSIADYGGKKEGIEEGIISNIFSSFSDYVKENKKPIYSIIIFLAILILLTLVMIKIVQNKKKNKKIKELEDNIQKINSPRERKEITDTGYREERRLVALAGISALIISFSFLLKPNFTGGVLGIPEINSLQTGLTIIICIFGALFLTGIILLLLKRFRHKNIYLPGRVGGLIHKKVYSENGYYIGEIKKIILKGNIIDFFQIKLDKRLKFKKKGIMLSYKYVKDIGHVVIVKKEISKHLNFK